MDKKSLSERDICTKFITPALRKDGWDEMEQIREEVSFTKGRIIVRGKLVSRGKGNRADYILYHKPNIPMAVIEAKDNTHAIGDGFVFHDRTGESAEQETTLSLDGFPTAGDLWTRYRAWKGLTPGTEEIVLQDYFDDGGGKTPRYYQINAINAAIAAIARGRDRILLVMATGTGKTYTAFQIIWRLWRYQIRHSLGQISEHGPSKGPCRYDRMLLSRLIAATEERQPKGRNHTVAPSPRDFPLQGDLVRGQRNGKDGPPRRFRPDGEGDIRRHHPDGRRLETRPNFASTQRRHQSARRLVRARRASGFYHPAD